MYWKDIKVDDDIFKYVVYYTWDDMLCENPNAIYPPQWDSHASRFNRYDYYPLTAVRHVL